MRRLSPEGDEIDVDALVGGLALADRAPADRPYTIVNFASSADGRATLDGRSGGLGDEGDRQIFRALRAVADAILVGTGTLRAERYGRLIKDPERRRGRELRGLAAEPLAVTVTRSGSVPTDIPLFAEPEARVVVFSAAAWTPPAGARAGGGAHVEVVPLAGDGSAMAPVLAALRRDHGVRLLLCEGGPSLFAALLREGLADELYLTLAPKLAAGTGTGITAGPALAEVTELRLAWALEATDSLFLRYERRS